MKITLGVRMKENQKKNNKARVFLLVAVMLFAVFAVPFTVEAAVVPPVVVTNAATGVTATNATLQGTLNSNGGAACTVRFQYGLTTAYGTNTTNQVLTGSTGNDTYYKIANPASIPGGGCYGVAINHNGTIMAVGSVASPYLFMYKLGSVNHTWYKIKFAGASPTNLVLKIAFSWNDTFMACAHQGSPFISIYKLGATNNTYTKIPNPASLPANHCYGVSFSPNGTYLAVASQVTSPFINIYKYTGGSTFTRLANPAVLPAGNANQVAFSHNGSYMVVTHAVSPFITIYKYGPVNHTWYKISNPATLPSGDGYGISFNANDTVMAVGINGGAGLNMYKLGAVNHTWYRIPNPNGAPTSAGFSTWFRDDSTYLAMTTSGSTYLWMYKLGASNNTYYKVANPVTVPTADTRDVKFSFNNTYMMVASTQSPYLWIYYVAGGTPLTFSKNVSGLTPGKLYHYRAYANNTVGSSTGSDYTLLTKPNAPTSLVLTNGALQQTLSWTHGTGYNRSVVRGQIGSYPASPQSGSEIYNGTGNTTINSGLGVGDHWYYRVWEFTIWGGGGSVFSTNYIQGNLTASNVHTAPTITTDDATGVTASTATLHATLTNDGNENCTIRFQYGLTTSYGTNTSNQIGRVASGNNTWYSIANPSALPATNTYGSGFSHNGTYMAIAEETSPYLTLYKLGPINHTYYRITYQGATPTGLTSRIAFSFNDSYMAVSHQASPYLSIYKYGAINHTFYKLPNPASLPGGDCYGVSFNANGTLIAVAHTNSPYMDLYKLGSVNHTWYKIPNPVSLPGGHGSLCAFSFNSTYLAVTNQGGSYLVIYKLGASNNTYYKIPDPNVVPTSIAYGVAFNANGTLLSVGFNGAPWEILYKLGPTNHTWYKAPNLAVMPTSRPFGIAFSNDGSYLSMAVESSPYLFFYKYGSTNHTYYKIANPLTAPSGQARGVSFSYDDGYMAVSQIGSPYVTLYRYSSPSGGPMPQNISGLTPGKLYHYRAYANNTIGYSTGSDVTFLTKPNAPSGITIHNLGGGVQHISWTHGTGYNLSVVRGQIGSYPSTPQSGSLIYNGTGSSVNNSGLTGGDVWYYRVWEFSVWSGKSQFSDSYAQSNLAASATVAPTVVTNNATLIGSRNATLNGELTSGGGEPCTVRFQYGLTTAYGTNTSNQTVSVTYGPGTNYSSFYQIANPSVLPDALGLSVAFSTNSTYMAVGHHDNIDPPTNEHFFTLYKLGPTNHTYYKIADPLPKATGSVYGCVFSQNGSYLVISESTPDIQPYLRIYKYGPVNHTFYGLPNPNVIPTGIAKDIAISDDGNWIAVAHENSPYVSLYHLGPANHTWYKYANPTPLPTGNGYCVDFNSNSTILAVGANTVPFLSLYKLGPVNQTWYRLPAPSHAPDYRIFCLEFSHNDSFLACGMEGGGGGDPHTTPPFVYFLKMGATNHTYYYYPQSRGGPADTPIETRGVAFSHDDQLLVYTYRGTPYESLYKFGPTNHSWYKLPDLSPNSGANSYSVAFNANDTVMTIGFLGTPYIHMYKRNLTGTGGPINNSFSAYISGLAPDNVYHYRAYANNSVGSSTGEDKTFTTLGIGDVYVDDDAASSWYNSKHVHTIQEGVNNATSGQTIFVFGGTYREPAGGTAHIMIVNKTLTIIGDENDMPHISPAMSNTTNQYIIYYSGKKYTLTLQYLDISNEWGGATTPVHYGIYVPSQNNLIVDHCVLHDINQVIKCYGNVTFTNNTAYHYKYRVLEGSWSAATYALHFVCKYNKIYDAVVTGINNEAIKPKYGHWYGDISYNYIAGCRVGIWIDEEGIGPLCKFGGNWTVSHNTIVSRYDPSNPDDVEQAISLTSTSDNFSKIHIRDNLISGCGYYAIHLGMYSVGYPYHDNTTIRNCLFWNYYTYWNDTFMHRSRYLNLTNQLYFQWNGTGYSTNIKYGPTDPHTICGWGYNTTAGYLFNMQSCVIANPLFMNISGTPATRWALQYGSPAVGAATDGTNIGAWQGTPEAEPLFLANEYPTNNTHSNSLSVDWHVVVDPDDIFNWTIQCSNGQSSSGTGDIGGIKYLPLSGLLPFTTYTVWVNATDGVKWVRATYYFTTGEMQPTYPGNFTETNSHVILYPNSDIRQEWTASGTTDHYTAVNTTGDSKYIYASAPAVDKFGLSNHTTQIGEITDVVIHAYLRASSDYDYPYWGVANGTQYWWTNGSTSIFSTYAWYNVSVGALSPWSGLPWTWRDIDMLTACIASTGEKTDYCDRLYVDVLYTTYTILDETPLPEMSYAHVYDTYLNVYVANQNNAHMNVSFYFVNATYIHTLSGVANATTTNLSLSSYILPHPWLHHDTTYYWYVLVQVGSNQAHGELWEIHTSKAWDCDENKVVNYLDVSILVSHYGNSGLIPGQISSDIIEDGVVNYLDISSLISHYGQSY